MNNPQEVLLLKLKKRYESNLQRSINALQELADKVPELLVSLESGHHYRSDDVDEIYHLVEHLRNSYVHVVECDNFIKEVKWLGHKEREDE